MQIYKIEMQIIDEDKKTMPPEQHLLHSNRLVPEASYLF